MQFSISSSAKKRISKLVVQNTKKLRRLKITSQLFILLGGVFGIVYGVLNFFIPNLSTVNINGVMTKDVAHILSTSALIITLGIFISISLYYLLKNMSGKNLEERVEESCLIIDDTLRYFFRVRYPSAPTSKIVVDIPLKNIKAIEYDEATCKLIIRGEISYTYFDDYRNTSKSINTVRKITKWEFYDYFSPSLFKTLQLKIK